MSCKLYLIRHGESMGNLTETFLGYTDLDLTERGRAQAEMAGEYLKSIPFDKIYSSDLIRAYHTACPLSEKTGIPIETRENLREIFAGQWENRRFDELAENDKEAYGVWMHDNAHARCTGGESVAELYDRIAKAITEIARENEGKTVAIFTHATPIKTFFAYINCHDENHVVDFSWVPNASVSEAVYENGVFQPVRYGYADFLGDLRTTLTGKV